MADEKQIALAKKVYNTLCESIDHNGWSYDKEEEKLLVSFTVSGEDLPMQFIMFIDVERQLVRLMSPLPFRFSMEKRMEGAIATGVATYAMADGSFDYDISDGETIFRMTASFKESLIGEGLFHYMIGCSCATVDEYNDKFLAISTGALSIDDFIAKQ